jgi:hypothetical protein
MSTRNQRQRAEIGPRVEGETDETLTVTLTIDKTWAREFMLFVGALVKKVTPRPHKTTGSDPRDL